jgi:hypothetical protein
MAQFTVIFSGGLTMNQMMEAIRAARGANITPVIADTFTFDAISGTDAKAIANLRQLMDNSLRSVRGKVTSLTHP